SDGWERFCRAIDAPALLADERFAENSLRVENAEALRLEIETRLREAPTDHWAAALRREGVAYAPVQTLDQVLASEQVGELGSIRDFAHPVAGEVREVRLPITFSSSPSTAEAPAPALDEHREARFGEVDDA
ncbi:MAG: CoA transferase, partial [Actinobacteria bacterium]|nr:CoA transferase [Actinomycetota bacterium]